MNKKILSFIMASSALVLGACSVQTEDEVNDSGTDTNQNVETTEKVSLEILGMGSNETDMNIVRDQLIKHGFDVELNTQPDYASYNSQKEAGNYDLVMNSWTTVTGNPDYAVRSLFITDGDYSTISNDEVDRLINEAALETPDNYVDTYTELEDTLVTENAYIVPLYNSLKAQAFNNNLLDSESIRLSKSRAFAWEPVSFVDEAMNETETVMYTQTISDLTSLDPIKANDGSINQLNTNMYVRLVNLSDDDQVVSDGSLSYNYAIAEGNEEYYFVLRDDINFAKVENDEAVDTGEMVSGQDVIYSLNRAKNPDSVPDHRTFSLHEHIDEVSLVEDLSELEDINLSDGLGNMLDALGKDLDSPIETLVEEADDVDNAAGDYQVVKLTTTEPFPQVLNYLGHQSAGIVSQKQLEAVNTYDIDSFDLNEDVPYGDQRAVTEGDSYDNHLYASGPYIMLKKNDYESTFQRNPGYMTNSDHSANIKNASVRFISDEDSALSALRAEEIHFLYGLNETKYDIVEEEDNLELQSMPSNGVSYMGFNMDDREVSESKDLRKSILYAISQEEINSAYEGNKLKAYSTLSPLIDTGNELTADPQKVEDFYEAYLENQ